MRAFASVGVLLCLATCAQADERTIELVGQAYDRASGAAIYSENHFQTLRDGALVAHRVEYRTPDGALFCRKQLLYGAHPFAPTFQLDDQRDGYLEGAEYTARGYRLYRREPGTDRSETVIAPGDDLVADSGFDRYVKASLAQLLVAPQDVRLAVAGQLAQFDFRIALARHERLFGRDAVTLTVRPRSLLRWFVAPIEVSYDPGTGALLRYAGISNIRNPSGKLYDARIDFVPADFRSSSGS